MEQSSPQIAPTQGNAQAEQSPLETASPATQFGELAKIWEADYVQRTVGGKALVAASTRQKYRHHLHNHILPRWGQVPIGRFRAKDVLDWLQTEAGSWYMMTDLRNIMSGIFTKAQDWEILPDTFANPISRVKLPRKWLVYERRILTEELTVRVLARMADPHRLVCEICIATGARISEVTGLQLKHIDLKTGTIRIEQRHWRGDIDSPKTERSKRTLTLGVLTERVGGWVRTLEASTPEAWLFPQPNRRKPMWDSGVRAALKGAAKSEQCDFPGFGPHSLRRANITWRQEVGGSSIEAARIAGHAGTKMTEEYTVVQLHRQDELTRRIQMKLAAVSASIPVPEQASLLSAQNSLALTSELSPDSHTTAEDGRQTMVSNKSGRTKEVRATKEGGNRTKRKLGSKKDLVLRMLRRKRGATLAELTAGTGWQPHSIRGFLSASVRKAMGLKLLKQAGKDGAIRYRLQS